MPDKSMWAKIRNKYRAGKRLVTTWNPVTCTGKQLEWSWGSGPPPTFAVHWTVIGMDRWHDFDGPEGEELKQRTAAEIGKAAIKARFSKANKKADVDPTKL